MLRKYSSKVNWLRLPSFDKFSDNTYMFKCLFHCCLLYFIVICYFFSKLLLLDPKQFNFKIDFHLPPLDFLHFSNEQCVGASLLLINIHQAIREGFQTGLVI